MTYQLPDPTTATPRDGQVCALAFLMTVAFESEHGGDELVKVLQAASGYDPSIFRDVTDVLVQEHLFNDVERWLGEQ